MSFTGISNVGKNLHIICENDVHIPMGNGKEGRKMIDRIIVADDEGIQRKVLSDVLKQILPEAEIVACSNGREAYEAVKKGGELLLTDICMPEMGGIELIERVSQTFPKIKIVLISAYQEFEYARSAIRCGVTEYLIKPFRVRDARELIERISRDLDLEREQELKLGHYDSILEERERVRQQDILRKLAAGYDSPAVCSLEEFSELRKAGTAAVIRWKDCEKVYDAECRTGLNHRQQAFLKERIKETVKEEYFLELDQGIDKKEHRAALLLPGKSVGEIFVWLDGLRREMKGQGILFWGGVSEEHASLLETLPKGVEQAEEALAFCFYKPREGGIFVYDQLRQALELPIKSMALFEKELRKTLHKGTLEELLTILERLRETLSAEPSQNPNKVRHRVSSILVSEIREMEGMIPQKEYDDLLNEAYDRYAQCDSLDGLFDISRELITVMFGLVHQGTDGYDAVEACVTYIKQHLNEEISLQTLSELVHFHPNYLSTQIRNRLGVPYSVYILRLRMELAGELLTKTDYKVADIAERCGFRDGSYFNRVFRREYQMAPEQYRKVHIRCQKK